MQKPKIAVFGTSRAKPDQDVYKTAYRVGKIVAELKMTVVNGGYQGSMLASAQGAYRAGGHTIGVVCKKFKTTTSNKYIKETIITDSLQKRLDKLIQISDGYIVLQGGTGTLLELAKVWELKNKGFINNTKPIILVGEFWEPIVNLMELDDPKSKDCVILLKKTEELERCLKKFFGNNNKK